VTRRVSRWVIARRVPWAAGDGQRVEGHGDTAEEAMADLANQLRTIRPDPNG